jgi:RNA polymerase sigma factor (sigma-70 family)
MDAELFDRLRARDPQAQVELRRELLPRVLAVCRRLLPDPSLAAEAAEDIWMDFAFGGLDRLRAPEAVSAYLRVMTVRRCVRLRDGWARHEELGERACPAGGPGGETSGAAVEEGLLMGLEQRRLRERLVRCLRRLSEKARRIVRMRFFLDLTQEQIGQSLGVSKQYAGRVIHRSLDALRACLEEAG